MNVKEKVSTTCLECGTVTLRQPCFADRKFCNRKCSTAYNNRARRKRETKPCPHCGIEFESLVCQEQKFCSRACADAGRKITVPLICEWCGEEYERHTGKASQSKYCGNACKTLAGAERAARKSMTKKEYDARLKAQNGVCAICRKPEVQVWRKGELKTIKLTRDHDHQTGAWRGLLCRKCNMALGLFGDDVSALLRAAEYVMKGGVPHDEPEDC